jgi:spoIIIJ-associated protein
MAIEIEFEGETLKKALEKACKFFSADENYIDYRIISDIENRNSEDNEKKVKILAKRKLEINLGSEAIQEKASLEKPAVATEEIAEQIAQNKNDLTAQERQYRVVDFLQDIISRAKLNLKIQGTEDDRQVIIDLSGPDKNLLLDNKGQLLSSLQYLLSKIFSNDRGFQSKVILDCDGYRKLREKELREIARKGASIAKSKGREYLLGFMNPYERRLIHITLKNDPGVTTKSRGDKFIKRVAIIPNKKVQNKNKKEM